MTKNEIAYWDYVERRRNNYAVERENNRHNLATEALSRAQLNHAMNQLKELERSNRAQELLSIQRNNETERHNRAGEYETKSRRIVETRLQQESIDNQKEYWDKMADINDRKVTNEEYATKHSVISNYIDNASDMVRSAAALWNSSTQSKKQKVDTADTIFGWVTKAGSFLEKVIPIV